MAEVWKENGDGLSVDAAVVATFPPKGTALPPKRGAGSDEPVPKGDVTETEPSPPLAPPPLLLPDSGEESNNPRPSGAPPFPPNPDPAVLLPTCAPPGLPPAPAPPAGDAATPPKSDGVTVPGLATAPAPVVRFGEKVVLGKEEPAGI